MSLQILELVSFVVLHWITEIYVNHQAGQYEFNNQALGDFHFCLFKTHLFKANINIKGKPGKVKC